MKNPINPSAQKKTLKNWGFLLARYLLYIMAKIFYHFIIIRLAPSRSHCLRGLAVECHALKRCTLDRGLTSDSALLNRVRSPKA